MEWRLMITIGVGVVLGVIALLILFVVVYLVLAFLDHTITQKRQKEALRNLSKNKDYQELLKDMDTSS